MKKSNFSTNEARAVSILAKTLNVAKAASLLDMSPNALNISISRTEQKINKTLFVRRQKTGEVTIPDGIEPVIAYIKTIAHAADLIEDQNKTWSTSATSGRVILSASQTILEHIVGPYIVDFVNKNPQVNLSFKQQDDIETATSGALNEIFISMCREVEDGYEYFPFHSFSQKYWAHRDYLDRFGSPQTIEDLFHHRVLLRKNLKDSRSLFSSMSISQGLPENNVKGYEIQGARIIDYLCERGMGIMAAAEETVRLAGLKVESVFPESLPNSIDVFVKVNKEFLKTPIARYFVDWLFECRDSALKKINIEPSFSYTKSNSLDKESDNS